MTGSNSKPEPGLRDCERCGERVEKGEPGWTDSARGRIWHKDCLTCRDCGGPLETHDHSWGKCLRCTECGHFWRVSQTGTLNPFPYKTPGPVREAPYNV